MCFPHPKIYYSHLEPSRRVMNTVISRDVNLQVQSGLPCTTLSTAGAGPDRPVHEAEGPLGPAELPWETSRRSESGTKSGWKFSSAHARMDSPMAGRYKNASRFKTSTSSHSKSFGKHWDLDPLPFLRAENSFELPPTRSSPQASSQSSVHVIEHFSRDV